MPNGLKFYKFKTPAQMPFKRLLEIQEYSTLMSINFTKEKLLQYVNILIAKTDKIEPTPEKLVALISDIRINLEALKALTEFKASEECILGLASMYFVMDGEPLLEPDPLFNTRKINLWKANPAAYTFFLRTAYQYTAISMDMSTEDMMQYLAQTATMREVLTNQLSK